MHAPSSFCLNVPKEGSSLNVYIYPYISTRLQTVFAYVMYLTLSLMPVPFSMCQLLGVSQITVVPV